MRNIFKYGIYLDFRKWIYLSLRNPFRTMNKLKGVFKPLRCFFRFSFKEWDYGPVLWCSKPSFIQIITEDVMWKDKDGTPRYENPPYIWIHIYKLNLVWYWDLANTLKLDPTNCIDDHWEQALWYLFYHSEYKMKKPDILSAENYWPWQDYKTKKSTWNNKFLIK